MLCLIWRTTLLTVIVVVGAVHSESDIPPWALNPPERKGVIYGCGTGDGTSEALVTGLSELLGTYQASVAQKSEDGGPNEAGGVRSHKVGSITIVSRFKSQLNVEDGQYEEIVSAGQNLVYEDSSRTAKLSNIERQVGPTATQTTKFEWKNCGAEEIFSELGAHGFEFTFYFSKEHKVWLLVEIPVKKLSKILEGLQQ